MKIGEFFAGLLLQFFDTLLSGGGCKAEDLTFSENLVKVSESIWGYLAILASGMTIMYFLIELNQKFAFEGRDLNLKSVGAPFLKLVFAMIMVAHGASIASNILGFHNGLVAWADDTLTVTALTSKEIGFLAGEESSETPAGDGTDTPETGSGGETANKLDADQRQKIKDKMKSTNIITLMGAIIPILLMWIIQLVLSLIWKYKAITYKLEFLWKLGVTPLALSDIYSGLSSNAIRWIKGLIATSIYGASFIILVKLGSSISLSGVLDSIDRIIEGENFLSAFLDGIGYMISFVVIPFAELGVLGAVKQATREALG